ncbi:MAG: hypothetical protein CMB56_002275 [Methanobacteriota archaeon]|nr:MAG: hypothetical protein CMB56_002275 [Euryarchaeota archaeon]
MNNVPFHLIPSLYGSSWGDMIPHTVMQSGRDRENGMNLLLVKQKRSFFMILLLLGVTFTTIQFASWQAMASSDQDGDGLITSIEYLLNTQIQNWDSDGDDLPDGWEWKYGLNPLSALVGDNGQTGDPDNDQLTNLQEYSYGIPANWDDPNTPDILDNGVWWNGTVPVNNWNEEGALQYNQPQCGDAGSDGNGAVILCDEDPVGDICSDGFDNDGDGQIDSQDPDNDGDAVCGSDDDDGDGLIDEDPYGWDTDADGLNDGWEVANGLDPTDPTGSNGGQGDPDGDGMVNLYEFINPSWDTQCNSADCFVPGPPPNQLTETESPCNPVTGDGPNGCANSVAEVDGNTQTNPNNPDTDGDGITDGDEVNIWLTDPTEADTDGDGITDGTEVNSGYGNPSLSTDPRNNNTDGDAWDDGEEDTNFNGQIDGNESDPTRREDTGDFDEDGIENWEENLTCTEWNNADTDYGGVSDGDELNPLHGTDPCDSLIDEETSIISWSSSDFILTISDATAFNPSGGRAWYQSTNGDLTEFSFSSISGNQLIGVGLPPTSGDIVVAKDGSWCRMDAESDGSISTSRQYCDDDFFDTDGDGLADWQERTGFFGFFSNHTNIDSDDDGQNDFDEVFGATDPLIPCENSLDDDGDGVNNYFESTTGCNLVYIGVLSGGNDNYVTDPLIFDTDNGGVGDLQEYFDGTNPEDVPSDDINPQDTDGDGIPDSIENITGTDWRNPDTDGGGLSDYIECPPQFWSTLCNGSGFDPFDPTDDVTDEDVVFWANSSSAFLDVNSPYYWRVNTYDNYTGGGYGIDSISRSKESISPNYLNTTWIADTSYSNGTNTWILEFNSPISGGLPVPMPHNWEALEVWSDATADLSRWDRVSTLTADGDPLFGLTTQAKQLWYDDVDFADSEPNIPSPLELELPTYFSDVNSKESIVSSITQEVISESGETSGYGIANALSEHLRQGNESLFYQINFNGSGVNQSDDIVWHILNNSREGTCSDFVTVYVTMARLAGIPARKVSGYLNGEQTLDGYEVTNLNSAVWAEIHLRSVSTGLDMGWIPIDPCPQPLDIEMVNMTFSPFEWDRNGTTNIVVEGDLVYSGNGTGVNGNTIRAYLAASPEEEGGTISTDSSMLIGQPILTNSTGHFIISGVPSEAVMPGFQKIVVVNSADGYIPPRVHEYPGHINVTDDSIIVHTSSTSIGQGATTDFSGTLSLENSPFIDISELAELTVNLDYVSQVSGAESLSTGVSRDGTWSFSLTLDPSEPIGPIQFTVSFLGWEDPDESYPGSPLHYRNSSILVNATVSLAPNLEASVEGHELDSLRLLVGNFVYVNGSANSAGSSPTPMDGLLELGIRENGSGLEYLVIFNKSVNGSFAISHLLNASDILIPAGQIDVRLRFYPNSLDTTDDADLPTDYLLRSYLTFEIFGDPQKRGTNANVVITASDHRGITTGLNLTGEFQHSFDGGLVETSTDPVNPIAVTWLTSDTLVPGDYIFETSFLGSELFEASVGQESIRIQGEAELDASLASNWVHIGEEGYIVGQLVDLKKNPPGQITGNSTEIIIEMLTLKGLEESIVGNGTLDVNTGEFNVSFTFPSGFAAGVYEFSITAIGLVEPAYYLMPNPVNISIGLESEFKLEVVDSEGSSLSSNNILNAPLSGELEFGVFAIDIGNNTNVSDRVIHAIFDWNGTPLNLPDEITEMWTITDERGGTTEIPGSANFTWSIPGGTAPGTYVMRIYIDDDIDDLISDEGAVRWLGNETFVDVTIQVPSAVVIEWIQPEVTAGAFFTVSGYVEDGDDNSRPFNGPISVKIYFSSNEDELLIASYTTNSTGWFNVSSPTDSALDGVASGDRTVVVEVINGSNIYYLPSSVNTLTHITGVSAFVELNHSAPIIINRGETLEVFTKLVETTATCSSCPYDTPVDVRLKNEQVSFLFDETWLPEQLTNSTGVVGFNYEIPYNQPLGTVTLTLYYNGSNDLHSITRNLPSTIVRSLTVLVVDPISENPVAGSSFNISGSIESDNGTYLMNRNGIPLIAQVKITMGGLNVQYLDGKINSNGTWFATVFVEPTVAAGTYEVIVSYNPQVPFYINSSNFSSVDIQGYAIIDFIEPGNLLNSDSKNRGDSIDVVVRVLDNAGQPVPNAFIDVFLLDTAESASTITNSSGLGELTIDIPENIDPGIYILEASWLGNIADLGSVGILGGNETVNFVVLAYTELNLDSVEGSRIVGEEIWINGTLLDDVGNPLLNSEGLPSGGLVRLYVDGLPVATVISDSESGFYSIEYELPEWMIAGTHEMFVEFSGGFIWIEPYASGDIENPEFYWNSSSPTPQLEFDVYVPTDVVVLTSQGSQVNRGSDLIINGTLEDIQNRKLDNRIIEIFVGGDDGSPDYFVSTDEDGFFTVSLRVPEDQLLGELEILLKYNGDEFNLSSESISEWYVYSTTTVTIDELSPQTLGDEIRITGTISDNLGQPLDDHQLRIYFDGITEIGIVNSSEDGSWSFSWVIVEGTSWGEHQISVISKEQAYYRESIAETSLFVAHRSAIEYSVEQDSVIRGGSWNISGVLFDDDDLSKTGLGNETLLLYLDGVLVQPLIVTESDGTWNYELPVDISLDRGEHVILIEFEGTINHIGSSDEQIVFTWSEVEMKFSELSSDYSVRSSEEFPIEIYGEISEIGGDNYKFSNLSLSLLTEEGVSISSELNWTVIGTQLFYINAKAPITLNPGNVILVVDFPGSDDNYLMPSSKNITILIKVDATFQTTIQPIILGDNEDIYGNVSVIADDNGEVLDGISVILTLSNESGELVTRTLITNELGFAEIILENKPSYSDTTTYGAVTLKITSDDSRISNKSLVTLQSEISESLVYQSTTVESNSSVYVGGSLIGFILLGLVGVLWYRRRKQDVLDEIASIFSYTAELLAHGDEIRESIFHCYEDLCKVLTKHGYLRRDFETVREFEMALRSALPIRDSFLIELDNVFEEARYSRHELNSQDALRAQSALEGVQSELSRMNVGKGNREEMKPET